MNKRKKIRKKIEDIEHKMSIENRKGDLRRARSVAVGTCFGGTTELMMRCNDGNVVWAVLQPVEVIELIHQLSANVGCHMMLQPREDFASWRNWRVSPEEKKHLNGHPPFVNDMAPFQNKGQVLPPPREQPGMALPEPEIVKEQPGIIEKPIKHRKNKKNPSTEASPE
jgi:hypothetical protein